MISEQGWSVAIIAEKDCSGAIIAE